MRIKSLHTSLCFSGAIMLLTLLSCSQKHSDIPGSTQGPSTTPSPQSTHLAINYDLIPVTGRLKIEILNAGVEGKIRVGGETFWALLSNLSAEWVTSDNNTYVSDRLLSSYTPGSVYQLNALNPTTGESAQVSINIPNDTDPVGEDGVALEVRIGNELTLIARNVGPNGEVRTLPSQEWQRFLPEKWESDGNNRFLSRPITNYTPGATYTVEVRNPDTGKTGRATINIPHRVDKAGTIFASYSLTGNRLKISVFNAGPLGQTKGEGTTEWTFFLATKWNTDGNNYVLERDLNAGEEGKVYFLGFRNPERGNEVWMKVDLNKSNGESVALIYSVADSKLRISAYGAGPAGQTKVENEGGGFDWTAFLVPSKWTKSGNDYFREASLSEYTAGSSYRMGIRNPDTGSEAYIYLNIPSP
ncbi:MAG: hypothetical protein KDD35_03510 [Bdellovibrionales bacterium]|nr:hypothetical protein [Bdellovibrionales bacterium]